MGRYLRVNLLGPGPRLMKKRINLAAVSQRLRNTAVVALVYGMKTGFWVGSPRRESLMSRVSRRMCNVMCAA